MGNQILLIDDDVDLLESFEESLQLVGYAVITATSGENGLKLFIENDPCIVFSDVKMPEMDGYELFLKIRKFNPSAKVVLITGYEDEEKTNIAKNNGLLDVLSKPISINTLSDTIKKNGY
ncbi:MAG: response regulator [Thaumarchaeota archaeon]|nr:response regulator [Nitrososphaerota archaeon]